MQHSIETALSKLPRHAAEELMLLKRRIRYLTAKSEYGSDAYMYASHLKDVASPKEFIEQLSKLLS